MARICLITPAHLSTNPRLVKEADALSEAGHDVRVISADFLGWARAADTEFGNRSWHVEEKLRFGPQAPLPVHVKQAIRQRTARLFAKLGIRGEAIDSAACHRIGPDLLNVVRRAPADLYIAHYVAALPAAAHAAKLNGALYAFDAEDFHLGDLPDLPQYAFEKSLIRAIEGRYLPGCAYVTAASPGIAEAYARTYGIARPTVVLNVFPRSQGAGDGNLTRYSIARALNLLVFSDDRKKSGAGMRGSRNSKGKIQTTSVSPRKSRRGIHQHPSRHCEERRDRAPIALSYARRRLPRWSVSRQCTMRACRERRGIRKIAGLP